MTRAQRNSTIRALEKMGSGNAVRSFGNGIKVWTHLIQILSALLTHKGYRLSTASMYE